MSPRKPSVAYGLILLLALASAGVWASRRAVTSRSVIADETDRWASFADESNLRVRLLDVTLDEAGVREVTAELLNCGDKKLLVEYSLACRELLESIRIWDESLKDPRCMVPQYADSAPDEEGVISDPVPEPDFGMREFEPGAHLRVQWQRNRSVRQFELRRMSDSDSFNCRPRTQPCRLSHGRYLVDAFLFLSYFNVRESQPSNGDVKRPFLGQAIMVSETKLWATVPETHDPEARE